MTYLTGQRLALAADRLRDTDDTMVAIARIARQVGHGSAFALSSAFTRVHGVSPREHRTRAARRARARAGRGRGGERGRGPAGGGPARPSRSAAA